MEVKLWDGGLLIHELNAISQIEAAFDEKNAPPSMAERKSKQTAMAQQLSGLIGDRKHPGMWPWKGYAGFRFSNSKGNDGEFDLVIVTHKNILIIELKHWHGTVVSSGDRWLQNGNDRGRSPVSVTRSKFFLLKNRIERIRDQLPGKKVPRIEYRVVMSGNCDLSGISENEKGFVLKLKDFLKLADERKFNKTFNHPQNAKDLNAYIGVFDRLFDDSNVQERDLVVDGYRAKEKIFSHPLGAYAEYEAVNDYHKLDRGLLRLWDFNKLSGNEPKTPEGRYRIISREQEVMTQIRLTEPELYKNCLRPLSNPSQDDMTRQFCERFELPSGHLRFNAFINSHVVGYSIQERLNVGKILVSQFARMHGAKVAHRDVGDHSIWLSPSNAVTLSNFIAAYFQPAGTVGEQRKELSIGAIQMPEDENPGVKADTPYKRDVFALGVLLWHLIQARNIPNTTDNALLSKIVGEAQRSKEWYAPIILKAIHETPSGRFADAGSFLQALNEGQPSNDEVFEFDEETLDRFRQPSLRVERVYRLDEEYVDNPLKEVYRSGSNVVKTWPGFEIGGDDLGAGPRLLAFLNTVERLQQLKLDFIPRIDEFGLAKRDEPFVVYQLVDGVHWSELSNLDREMRFDVIERLCDHVAFMHEQDIAHGDLHPDNVKVCLSEESEGSFLVYLLDFPDLAIDSDETKNFRYSPPAENASPYERDNFAVLRMSAELLGMEWDIARDSDLTGIREIINLEQGSRAGFLSLDRFRDATRKERNPRAERPTVSIQTSRVTDQLTILPDNGELLVSVEPDRKQERMLTVKFSGIGGNFLCTYDPSEHKFGRIIFLNTQDDIWARDRNNAQYRIDCAIRLTQHSHDDCSGLNRFFDDNEDFLGLVEDVRRLSAGKQVPKELEKAEQAEDEQTETVEDEPFKSQKPAEPSPQSRKRDISINRLWKTIIDTETEGLPSIEVSEEPSPTRDHSYIRIPYSAEGAVLDSFENDDQVRLARKKGDKTLYLGYVDIRKSSGKEIFVDSTSKTRSIRADETLYLVSKQNKTSLDRRKKAVSRVLDQLSVIPDLTAYFEERSGKVPERLSEEPAEQDFELYQREDRETGKTIGLNLAQREAFKKLIAYGPVGLLQGPPGTGKTEFIAAFCHYLVSRENVKNILLVSQSHEAVNTAVERIRSHCRKFDTDLDVVRFSNSDQAVSDGLKDVYSNAIVNQRKALFEAEQNHRLTSLAQSLQVHPAFIEKLLIVEKNVRRPIEQIERLDKDLKSTELDARIQRDMQVERDAYLSILSSSLAEHFFTAMPEEGDYKKLVSEIHDAVCDEFGARPHELRRCLSLIRVSEEMLQRLESKSSNYDEFLVRSRTLVCGTCVGMGKSHLALNKTPFDWVIIDEAARSSSSELAVAMQVGKRVLLVGDHRQLPPTYQDDHKLGIAREFGVAPKSDELDFIMRSDFERAFESSYGKQIGATLTMQYRMNKAIGGLVSSVFYGGRLETGERRIPDCFSYAPSEIRSEVTWLDTGVLGERAHHKGGANKSKYNELEAEEIVSLLKAIENDDEFCSGLLDTVSDDKEPTIGVICMYAEQKRFLKRKFAAQNWSDEFRATVKIDTVDSYQGKENRIIVLSLTRSDAERTSGFLRSDNRVNVAMSRAMDRLVIVGDMRVWSGKNGHYGLGRVASYIRDHQEQSGFDILPASKQKGGK
ncbi:nuclease [Marinobacter sp. R17]|uniref:AAA domain-containing protein n=1 Tax=Marinobacter sp. R17 TaxID=2484250 RepID=UPI000F4B5B4A|nr:AAA domain-containing protein [Marinobacter sp. R17]ROU00074.1 nuclease [Marinobacter sp. R17]